MQNQQRDNRETQEEDRATQIKNFVPHCPEALHYVKVWGRDVVRSLTLAYAIYKILFNKSVSGNVA